MHSKKACFDKCIRKDVELSLHFRFLFYGQALLAGAASNNVFTKTPSLPSRFLDGFFVFRKFEQKNRVRRHNAKLSQNLC